MNSCSTSRLAASSSVSHLQPRAGADRVVGQRRDDPPGVAVIGDLVAGPAAEQQCERGGCWPRRPTRDRHWPSAGGSLRWSARRRSARGRAAERGRRGASAAASCDRRCSSPSPSIQTVPGGTNFFRPMPNPLRGGSPFCFPGSGRRRSVPAAVLLHAARIARGPHGPWALSRIACSRSSAIGQSKSLGRMQSPLSVDLPGGIVSCRSFLQNSPCYQ